ncbi:AbrB/MazE/SpoVT family DNA-binding domain-containing protein [Candidatus Woesearchaeota archaeon]|nr:AbrB/MazE/SpoVT family DNA-binding domain-containing protein [Candidatus Woesearchaeota archaeon]
MQSRKIIKIAENTQVITLPSRWLRKFNLRKGDDVQIQEHYNKIIVSTELPTALFEAKADFSKIKTIEATEAILSSLYKKGFDIIAILCQDHETKSNINKVLRHILREFKIEKETEMIVTIKNMQAENQSQIENGIQRAFVTTINLAEQTLKELETNKRNLKKLIYLEEENDHVTSQTQRLLTKFGFNDFQGTNFAYAIVRDVEKICDHYADLIIFLGKNKEEKLSERTMEYFKQTNQLLKDYYLLLNRFDINEVAKLKEKRKELQEKGQSLLKNNPAIHFLLSINEKLMELPGPLIALKN